MKVFVTERDFWDIFLSLNGIDFFGVNLGKGKRMFSQNDYDEVELGCSFKLGDACIKGINKKFPIEFTYAYNYDFIKFYISLITTEEADVAFREIYKKLSAVSKAIKYNLDTSIRIDELGLFRETVCTFDALDVDDGVTEYRITVTLGQEDY